MATQAVPNATPTHCDMATELVPNEIENDHRGYGKVYRMVYRIIYWMASQEPVETTTKRWWPRSHSDRFHCRRTSHGDRMRGLPGALPYQATDQDAYRMANRSIKNYCRTAYRTECRTILPNDYREANRYSTEAAYRDSQGKSADNVPKPSSECLLPRSGPPISYWRCRIKRCRNPHMQSCFPRAEAHSFRGEYDYVL